jgi:hypothetical protein
MARRCGYQIRWSKFWTTLFTLAAAWGMIGGYVFLGGKVLNSLELQAEKDAATDYCVKIDMLLSGLGAGQRKRFSALLNTLVGSGMCRAPICKPQVLPSVSMMYNLQSSNCSAFMGSTKDSFVESIEAAFLKHPQTMRYPISVEVTSCTDADNSMLRFLAPSSITLAATISSDTGEAINRITEVCEDEASFMIFYNASRRRRLQANGLSAVLQPPKPVTGQPMMVVDVTSLDTYPGSVFQQPGKAPGEPLDGFAAVDPVTGSFLPIAMPLPGQTKVEVAILEPSDQCADEEQGSSTRRKLEASPLIRLVGGNGVSTGRIEVFYSTWGVWNTICDDEFDSTDAFVACRMLGFYGGGTVRGVGNPPFYGAGSGNIIFDNMGCVGWESSLFECSHHGYGNSNCDHGEGEHFFA